MNTIELTQALEAFSHCWVENPYLNDNMLKRKTAAQNLEAKYKKSLTVLIVEQLSWLLEQPPGDFEDQLTRLTLAYGYHQSLLNNDQNRPWLDSLGETTVRWFTKKKWNLQGVVQAAVRCHNLMEPVGGTEQLIAGDSAIIKNLKRKIWSACFGHDLTIALKLHQLLREESVLLLGESGTGKESVAKIIAAATFLPEGEKAPDLTIVNASAFPSELIESELFGHVKGSFTGAINDKKGLIEEANQGTFFLDEIGDLSPKTQPKLLRALENRTIRKVGGNKDIKVNVKFIAATNKPLEEMVRQELFREDLYYRLNGFIIELPNLATLTADDRIAIAKHGLPKNLRVELGMKQSKLTQIIGSRALRGNMRELKNIVRSLLLRKGSDLERDVPVQSDPETKIEYLPHGIIENSWTWKQVKDWYFDRILEASKKRVGQAATTLDLSRQTLYAHIKKKR